MPKKILLIENDAAFAERLSGTLEAAGFDVRATGDGKEGLDLARDWAPDAIVLCVELPSMSGYLVCQKLKKDDGLKAIPLVLTSGEATEETFDKHRTLKARADEYLLKPYEPEALIGKLGSLIGLPDPADVPADVGEELVSLEVEVGLESADGEPEAEVPGLSLESLPDEPVAAEPGLAVDDDLRLLDDAFDGLAVVPAPQEAAAALDELTGERPMPGDEVDAAAASLPDDDERAPRADFAALDDEAEAALGILAADEALSLGAPAALDETRPIIVPPPPPRDAEVRAAGEGGGAMLRGDLAAKDAEVRELRRKLDALSRRAEDAEAELVQARSRADAAQEKVRKAEGDAKAGREEARRAAEQVRAAESEIGELRRKSGEAEQRAAEAERRAAAAEEDARRKAVDLAAAAQAVSRAEALEREAEELRTELLVARGEADGARGEVDRRTADLAKRVAELEATNAKNEERVVKAYQKIKADEKVRDKVRKALAIATQLLEEGIPPESPAEKERRAAAALAGRE
jgi:CheY-like chemotaxis protein